MFKQYNSIFSGVIVAVLPDYDEDGNNICSIIYSDGKTEIVTMGVSKFLSDWAYFLRVHFVTQRMWSQEVLNRKKLTPIVLSEEIILIPIKTRIAYGSKDGCYGYLLLNGIESFNKDYILLYNGITISHLSATKTLSDKIHCASLLLCAYKVESKIQKKIYTQYQREAIYRAKETSLSWDRPCNILHFNPYSGREVQNIL